MPELPEVQTVVNDLQKIVDNKIINFWSDFEKAIKAPTDKKKFAKNILGQKITRVFRGGKNIILTLQNKSAIIVHLKMTGQLLLKISNPKSQMSKEKNKYDNYIHHIFYLDNKATLNFSDIRKFGTLELVDEKTLSKKLEEKGLDPFSEQYTFANFQNLLERGKNKNLKQFLMDQSYVAGIGNIYASEIPFDIKTSPLRKINSLNSVEAKKLFGSIKKILSQAIELRGTSFSDYRDSSGKKGSFQNFLKVYKRDGQKCKRCDTIIEKSVIGQRSTFHCPKCQN
ncbi:MAG: bifunctional DNA-formamidopyrimidine glycosylase/DNA-(apurinic or apyrimidinic site) lyase [Candidatus Moranbacteria bacterium]|nr:bifunctional DNA-formamidopyrimidine glycosylase/DNA-(apurinic or apyrimidinic site) lyase [Candidatus Moranbacteria bacterium]